MGIIDLTGQKFGRLTVLYLLDKRTKKKGTIWHCKCECGIEKDIPGETLRRGESKSCGCLQREVASQNGSSSFIDITGQKFGKLTALKPIKKSKNCNKHTIWLCQCECGNITKVDLGNLRSGKSRSCGCVLSHQEENIIKLLKSNNVPYEYHYEFKGLPNKKFDFYVNNQYIIEFDGEQHFQYIKYGWSNKEKLIRTHKNDLIKNQFCFNNNIPLIRIPYNQEYTFDDLMLNNTRFLLTKDNEREYYKTDQLLNEYCCEIQLKPFDLPITNKSGYPGVSNRGNPNIWTAFIMVNGKYNFLGSFNSKKEAIEVRMMAEIYYYGRILYKTDDCGVDIDIDKIKGLNITELPKKKINCNNTSGTTGVYWNKRKQKWTACIGFNNKNVFLGSFKNKDDAIKARKQAEKKYFGKLTP